MKPRLLTLAVCLAFVAAAHAACAEGLTLKYKVSEKIKISAIAAAQPSLTKVLLEKREDTSEKAYVVTLAPGVLNIRAGDEEKLFDFVKKSFTLIDHAAKTYTVMPLHTMPLARSNLRRQATQKAIDWENASGTGKMVKTMSGIALDVNGPLVDLDALYASAGENKSSHLIRATVVGETHKFETDDGLLASFTLSSTPVPADLSLVYHRLFVYGADIHPDVEKAIAASPSVLQTLAYRTDDHVGRVTQGTWTLEGTEPAGALPKVPEGYTEHFSLDAAINTAMTSARKPGPDADYFGKQVQTFLAQNDPLRALLALHEALLSLPKEKTDPLDPLTLKVLSAGGGAIVEGTMLTLTQNFTTKGDLDMSNASLKNAKAAAKDYTYLLDVFRARNIRQQLLLDERAGKPFNEKEFVKSVRMDMNAIATNPWMATAYADLGDALFEHGDSMLAWTCWQEAERMKPDIPSLKKVAELKARAEKEFPEYF
ncbi:MAG TPA: hypothetical protein VEF76_13040 [Patescibacteria group bacterium]|nr:hypothetical protein [Patescibacteria group bacterium]